MIGVQGAVHISQSLYSTCTARLSPEDLNQTRTKAIQSLLLACFYLGVEVHHRRDGGDHAVPLGHKVARA